MIDIVARYNVNRCMYIGHAVYVQNVLELYQCDGA